MSGDRDSRSEYPRPQHMSLFWPSGPPLEDLSQHDLDRIAEQRNREDEVLGKRHRPSLWRRVFGRRGDQ